MPYPDQGCWCDCIMCFSDADLVLSFGGWQNENWICNDFIHGEYHIIQDGGPKWWLYCERKLEIFFCFLKVWNGWQVVSKLYAGTYKKRVKWNSSSGQTVSTTTNMDPCVYM